MAATLMKMTEARVRDAGPGEYLDETGKVLRLYVTAKGRSFGVYVWNPEKKYAVRRSLGKWPALTVDKARERAVEEEKKILAGEVKLAPKESTLGELVGDHPELVFASRYRNTEGGHIQDAGGAWQRVLARAEVKNVTIHDLRRSFGSQLVNAGVPITVVAKALGHADVKTTIRHYSVVESHVVREALEKVAAF